MVKLRLFSVLRQIAGAKEVEVPGAGLTVRAALARFAEAHGDRARSVLFGSRGELLAGVVLLVNGEMAREGPDTRLESDDLVAVLLPVAGG